MPVALCNFIAQAAGIEEAIAKVKTQHPQETGRLETIAVGGILAPDHIKKLLRIDCC